MPGYQPLGRILERYDIPVRYYTIAGRTTNVEWEGLMFHHTASNPPRELPSLGTVQQGRPDVQGPLANFMGPRGGAYAAHITDGGANHPGAGDINVLHRLRQGLQPTGRPGPDTAGASSHARRALIGWEVENSGVGEPWAVTTVDLVAHSFAAFCMEFRWNPLVVIVAHKEWTRRKIDPFPIDMVAFRYQVVLLTRTDNPLNPVKPTPSEEDYLMAAADDIIAAINAHTDTKIAEAFASTEAKQGTWEWDTRKLTVPRAIGIQGERAQYRIVETEQGTGRVWIKNQAEAKLLQFANKLSYADPVFLAPDSAEAEAFRKLPIYGPSPA